MKSTFFIILIILGNICFSCAKQKVEGLDTRFRAIDDYLGRYVEIKFMNDELRNKDIYKYPYE